MQSLRKARCLPHVCPAHAMHLASNISALLCAFKSRSEGARTLDPFVALGSVVQGPAAPSASRLTSLWLHVGWSMMRRSRQRRLSTLLRVQKMLLSQKFVLALCARWWCGRRLGEASGLGSDPRLSRSRHASTSQLLLSERLRSQQLLQRQLLRQQRQQQYHLCPRRRQILSLHPQAGRKIRAGQLHLQHLRVQRRPVRKSSTHP